MALRFRLFLLTVFWTSLAACAGLHGEPSNAPLAAAPSFKLPCLDGRLLSPEKLQDRYVLLHFWATWCSSCVQELDGLHNLYRYLHSDRFEILAIAVDDSWEAIRKVQSVHNLSFPILFDENGSVRDSYRVQALPETILLDGNWRPVKIIDPATSALVDRVSGPQVWDKPEVATFFTELIKR